MAQTIKYFPPEPQAHKAKCVCYACLVALRAKLAIYQPMTYTRRASTRLTSEQVKAAYDKAR